MVVLEVSFSPLNEIEETNIFAQSCCGAQTKSRAIPSAVRGRADLVFSQLESNDAELAVIADLRRKARTTSRWKRKIREFDVLVKFLRVQRTVRQKKRAQKISDQRGKFRFSWNRESFFRIRGA